MKLEKSAEGIVREFILFAEGLNKLNSVKSK